MASRRRWQRQVDDQPYQALWDALGRVAIQASDEGREAFQAVLEGAETKLALPNLVQVEGSPRRLTAAAKDQTHFVEVESARAASGRSVNPRLTSHERWWSTSRLRVPSPAPSRWDLAHST